MNKIPILEYLRTIILTLLASIMLLILVIIGIQHQVISEVSPSEKVQEDTVDYNLIGLMIDKHKYLEQQNPKNYRINLKLGTLEELKGDKANAEIDYKKAIEKAPFGEYEPVYKLALLYLTENRLDEAQALIDNLGEHPSKKLIDYKAEIYHALGDKYYNKADYEEATFKYEKSLSYYKVLKSKKGEEIKGDLASAYVYLAETRLNQLEIDQAIDYLQMANQIVDSPIIKYKLALLLIKYNPELAYKYFKEVFKIAPEIINYTEYENFLTQLANNAEDSGEYTQAELYRYEMKKVKDYSSSNIISVDAISLESANGEFSYSLLRQKYNIHFDCILKNISQTDITSLYLQIVFEAKHRILYTYTQPIADEKMILAAGASAPTIDFKTSIPGVKQSDATEKISAKIYLSKKEDSYRIFLKEIPLTKKVKKRWIIKLFGLKFYLPRF